MDKQHVVEEAVYDRMSFQHFLGFDCFKCDAPDGSSICRFRHLLEDHHLTEKIFQAVNNYLPELWIRKSTININ